MPRPLHLHGHEPANTMNRTKVDLLPLAVYYAHEPRVFQLYGAGVQASLRTVTHIAPPSTDYTSSNESTLVDTHENVTGDEIQEQGKKKYRERMKEKAKAMKKVLRAGQWFLKNVF